MNFSTPTMLWTQSGSEAKNRALSLCRLGRTRLERADTVVEYCDVFLWNDLNRPQVVAAALVHGPERMKASGLFCKAFHCGQVYVPPAPPGSPRPAARAPASTVANVRAANRFRVAAEVFTGGDRPAFDAGRPGHPGD